MRFETLYNWANVHILKWYGEPLMFIPTRQIISSRYLNKTFFCTIFSFSPERAWKKHIFNANFFIIIILKILTPGNRAVKSPLLIWHFSSLYESKQTNRKTVGCLFSTGNFAVNVSQRSHCKADIRLPIAEAYFLQFC